MGDGEDGGIRERLAAVEARIADACARAGRPREDVTLVAVSKTFGPDDVRAAEAEGISVFGESRIQEAAEKISACSGSLTWHFIGHLQTNKARAAVSLFSLIHSIDSKRLLEAVDREAREAGRVMPVLLEVNVSGEGSKFGLAPDAVPEVIEAANDLMNVKIEGLMTIPPFAEDPEGARPYFRQLRDLRDRCRAASGIELDQLSMGMSGDMAVAIEEGATLVRVGSAIFGRRPKRVE